MADAVDIDLYDDDLEQDFAHVKEESIDLYDDVIAGSSEAPASTSGPAETTNDQNHVATTNGPQNTSTARRFQLYVGNLTWWTSDRDITEAIQAIGVNDLVDVKFFENRTNGQSKGFCVIGLASESSMRLCIERLSKQDIHGQLPVVTYPTKQALSQFESQSKTRPVPPPAPNVQRPSAPQPQTQPLLSNSGLPLPLLMPQQQQQQQQSQQQQQAQQQVRVRMPPPNIRPGPPMQAGPPRMNGPPPPHQISQLGVQYKINMTLNGPMQSQLPPNYQGGPPRPGMQPPQGMAPQGRGPAPSNMPFGGPPQMQGMTPRGPPPHPSQQIMNSDARGIRPDWNRPPGPNMQPGGSMFTNHHMQGPPHQVMLPGQGPMHRAPGPGQLSGPSVHGMPPPVSNQGPVHGPPQVNNSSHGHVNPPQYFPPGGPPAGQSGPPPHMSHGPPPPGYSQSSSRPPYSGPDSRDHHMDQDYEEIMSRNRTVSSSAITRAVADAAAGDYESAVETLMTAVSLIKQSKVANDDRCKILISSLQDTIHGIEAKRYVHSRRERSRSRDRERSHRRRRDRSRSRERDYRERSREREREHRDKDRYYSDMYPRERTRSRDRDRERERERDYRDRSREESSTRVNTRNRVKSPPDTVDPASVATVSSKTSSSRYYEERYRERDRERDRDRDRDSRHVERDRDRDRREERGESSHRSSRH